MRDFMQQQAFGTRVGLNVRATVGKSVRQLSQASSGNGSRLGEHTHVLLLEAFVRGRLARKPYEFLCRRLTQFRQTFDISDEGTSAVISSPACLSRLGETGQAATYV